MFRDFQFSEFQKYRLFTLGLNTYLADTCDENVIPSLSASNSTKCNKKIISTSTAFKPILPHPATSYDSIFTSIINFQNVLRQTGNISGALWCDDGFII